MNNFNGLIKNKKKKKLLLNTYKKNSNYLKEWYKLKRILLAINKNLGRIIYYSFFIFCYIYFLILIFI